MSIRMIKLFTFIFLSWLTVIVVCGWVRPLLPSNELRYISVAWEMWVHHSFIVPLQGIEPYPHKPPLLFWLVHGGWWIFGVNSWWPRLVPELFSLGSLILTYLLSRQLWPKQTRIAELSTLLLIGMLGWLSQLALFKFDIIVTFFVLCVLYCLSQLSLKKYWWYLLAFAIALGVLTKGPVCLLFMLPPALLLPLSLRNLAFKSHYLFFILRLSLVLLLAIVLLLLWAVPAAYLGGKAYTEAILWHQSAGRIAGEYGGIKGWYAYIEFLAWLLLPWTLWIKLWRNLGQTLKEWRLQGQNSGLRFILTVIIPALFMLSLIPVKSERYIVPLLPLFAMLLAYVLAQKNDDCRRFEQWLLAFAYIIIGIVYLLLPHMASPVFQQRVYWLNELSPFWGCSLIMLGLILGLIYFKNVLSNVMWLSATSVILFVIYNIGIVQVIAKHNDLRPMAQELSKIEQNNQPIALYQSDFEFEFFGRLKKPTTIINSQHSLKKWLMLNPNGWVVSINDKVYPKEYILRPAKWYGYETKSDGKR